MREVEAGGGRGEMGRVGALLEGMVLLVEEGLLETVVSHLCETRGEKGRHIRRTRGEGMGLRLRERMKRGRDVNGLARVPGRKHEEKGETHEAGRLRNWESAVRRRRWPGKAGDLPEQSLGDKSRNGPGGGGQGRCSGCLGAQDGAGRDPFLGGGGAIGRQTTRGEECEE